MWFLDPRLVGPREANWEGFCITKTGWIIHNLSCFLQSVSISLGGACPWDHQIGHPSKKSRVIHGCKMSFCPRKLLRFISTACHQGPANNSFSSRSSPPVRCSREGKLLFPAPWAPVTLLAKQDSAWYRNNIYNSFQTPGPWRMPPEGGKRLYSQCPRPQLLVDALSS